MYHVDPTMDMVFRTYGMCLLIIILSVIMFNILRFLLLFVLTVLQTGLNKKTRYTRIYSKNAFCRSINCEALGYFGCSIPGCRHTAKDLERWLKQNKYGITTENKS